VELWTAEEEDAAAVVAKVVGVVEAVDEAGAAVVAVVLAAPVVAAPVVAAPDPVPSLGPL
jgi:K+/H+ antiporter YhaU regulatory subunit KhtT